MVFLYKYSIDTFQARSITGWCFHRLKPRTPLTLVLYAGAKVLGQCRAGELREDLRELKIHPDGRCGFTFVLPNGLSESPEEELRVCVAGKDVPLARLKKSDMGRVLSDRKSLTGWVKKRLSGQGRQVRPVFFLHIPKTAGTTFNAFARSCYQQHEILTHIESYDHNEYPSIARNYKFISGHLRIGEVKKYFSVEDLSLYTLIREPYAHLHSHLNWLRGIGSDREGGFYQGHHEIFRGLADEYGNRDNLSHSDLQKLVDDLSGVLRELLDNCQSRHFLDSKPAIVDLSCRHEVMENFALFTRVGLTENYADFLKEFCKNGSLTFSERSPNPLNRARFAPLFDHRDPVVREIVQPLVVVDLLLYRFAQDTSSAS